MTAAKCKERIDVLKTSLPHSTESRPGLLSFTVLLPPSPEMLDLFRQV